VEVFDGERSLTRLAASPLSRALITFLREAGLTRKLLSDYKKWAAQLVGAEGKNGEGQALQSAAAAEEAEDAEAKAEEKQSSKGTVAAETASGDVKVPSSAEALGEPIAVEAPQKSEELSTEEAAPKPSAPQQEEPPPQISEGAEGAAVEKEVPGEAVKGPAQEVEEAAREAPPELAAQPPISAERAEAAAVVEPQEAVSASAEAKPAAAEQPANVECTKVTFGRCSALGITEALVERARREPAGVKLALLALWRSVIASLKADMKSLEPLWLEAGLDPQAAISAEDRARAEVVAEEALAGCRLCVVDLPTFLKLVRRITLAERPDGDAMLVVDVGYNGDEVGVATRLTAWIKEKKDETQYVIPLILRERLRQLGLALDVDAHDLYVELVHRAERYQVTADAYIKPILLHAVEALRASPHLAKCTKDNRVIYIASELFRTSRWYFDSKVGLGRNKLYLAFRRHGLLTRAETVVVEFVDEYGEKVRRRALAFRIDRLSAFIEFDVSQLCKAVGLMVEEEKAWDAEPQGAAPGVEA
jgi:hypothetical protein